MGKSVSLTSSAVAADRFSRWEKVTVIVLAVAGIVVSAYLTYVHLSHTFAYCAVGDCERVNSSPYAETLGLPVAIWGMSGYVAILAVTLWQFFARTDSKWTALAVFGLSLMGVLFSAYLTYLEIAVIQAICMWCVISAIIMTAIFVFASRAVYRFSS